MGSRQVRSVRAPSWGRSGWAARSLDERSNGTWRARAALAESGKRLEMRPSSVRVISVPRPIPSGPRVACRRGNAGPGFSPLKTTNRSMLGGFLPGLCP